MGEGVRSWGARAAYTGLAICGFRVQIDQFNRLSSCQSVCCPSSSSHLSSLGSVPKFFPFVLCFFFFSFLLLCLRVNWLSSVNCWKTLWWWWSFASWWVFLVAQGSSWVGEGPAHPGDGVGMVCDCPLPSTSHHYTCVLTSFSFAFITLHQFDPISSPFYSPNISNQWRIFRFLWLLLKLFRRIPGTSPWRFKYSGTSCQWLVLWLVAGSTG